MDVESSNRSLLGRGGPGVESGCYEDLTYEEGEGGESYTSSWQRRWNERRDSGIDWKKAFFWLLGGYIFTFGLVIYIWPTGDDELKSSIKLQESLPDIPSRVVTFNRDANFYPTPTNNSLSQPELFAALQPKSKGFVTITNPSLYGLSGGIPSSSDPSEEGYCISMFHQLHCLDGLRSLLDPSNYDSNGRPKIEGHGRMHVDHCVDYLRQSIMCAGDTTLEKSVVIDGVRTSATDGWGIGHVCRDFGSIFEWAAEKGFVADE